MAYISVSLSQNDPQPGNYSIYIQDCNGGSEVLVNENLINPTDFPYTINTDDFIDYDDCINYRVVETLSGCESTGVIRPTGTGSTPTPTPTTTTQDDEHIDISFTISEGSTIINFSASASKQVTIDTVIEFNYVLYRNDGTTRTIPVSMTILNGNSSVTKEVRLKDEVYSNVDNSVQSIKDVTSNNDEFTINRYTDKTISNSKVTYVNYDFVSCCDKNDVITAKVDSASSEKWIKNGNVVMFKGQCYKPSSLSKNTDSVTTFFGPDYVSCKSTECPDCTQPTPTPTPSSIANRLSNSYTLRTVEDSDGNFIDVNIKNSLLYRKALKYNGKCYTILEDSEQEYNIGINDVRKPIINDRDTFDHINFCKVSLGQTLSLTIQELQEVSPKNIKKIPFSPQIAQSLTNVTVNALADCGETVRNPDIFVFYDGTGSYVSDDIQSTSNSVRQWYTSLLVQGLGSTEPDQNGETQTSYSGRLFEGIFKKQEQILTLASYPTLGSLSGGTLPAIGVNDEQVITHNPAWQTWFKTTGSTGGPLSQNMYLGTPYNGGGDTYIDSTGTAHPFSGYTHPAAASQILVGNGWSSINNTYGDISQEYLDLYNDGLPFTDAIVIIFSNEFTEGYSVSSTTPQVSSTLNLQDLWAEFLDDYYKVWRYNIDCGNPPLNFVFSNPQYPGNLQTSSSYLYGSMSLMEMTNFNTVELQEKYSQNYFEDGTEVIVTWPEINPYLNNNDNGNGLFYNDFSLLETGGGDMFSWVDGTTVPTYGEILSNTDYAFYTQNGPGLSNFGFTLDVNLSTYNINAVRDRLTSYINLALENALSGYILLECDHEVLDDNYVCFNAGQIVLYNGNCYEVVTNLLQGDNPYYETGTFLLDDEIYVQVTAGSQSNFVSNIEDCEDCRCSEESGLVNTNWRVSIVIANNNGVDTDVTVHGVYMPNTDLLTTQGIFTVPANSTLTVSGFELDPDACIVMEDTMNGLPIGTYIDSMGDCCDPTDPVEPTPTPTSSLTPTTTPSVTPSITPSITPSSTPPPSLTPTPTASITPTVTPTVTATPTQTPSQTPTQTPTPTPSVTPGETPTPTQSITPTPSATPYVCDDSQYTINYDQIGFSFSSDCHLDNLVFTISVSGPQEPVSGQLNLISIFGNDGSQLTQLVNTVDFTAVYTGANLITVTISPEVYSLYQTEVPNVITTISTFEITVETPFGCVLTSTAELQTCQCPEFQMFKPCDESGVILGELLTYSGDTDTYSYQGNQYTIPMSVIDLCDLSPLATLSNGVYVITLESLEAAYYYHLANQSNPNVVSTFFSTVTQPYSVLNSSDLAYFQSISNDGIVYVLNDDITCFQHENMLYTASNEVQQTDPNIITQIFVMDVDGVEACYEYIGQIRNCDGSIEITPEFNGVVAGPYNDCADCIDTNFPTPTPTPTPSTSTPSNYCEIQISDFGYKSTSLGNVQVNVVSNYLQLPTLDTVYAYSEQHDSYGEVLPYHNEPQGESEWQLTLVNPSLCTYYKSFDMWQTTTLVNGVAQNQEMWQNIRVNRITKPIYIGCDSDCTRNTVLRDENALVLRWGTFKNGYLEYDGSQNDDYVTTLPLVVYDETVDTVYRIATLDILQAIDNGTFINGYNYNVSDSDTLFVEVVSNCETNDDIFVTDAPGGGWLINGESNPTLSFEDGKTYRFHVNSNKDFWIGYNNESTVQVNIYEDDPCVDAVWVDTINPNSILNTCDLTDKFCNSSTATAESDCGVIVHEKTSPSWTNLTTKNKTVIFRPKCSHNCNRHLFYYDRLDARDCTSLGRMLIKDVSDCSQGVVVTHFGTLSEETGLVPGLLVTWSDCEGNGYSDVVVYPYEPTENGQIPYNWTIPGCVNVDSVVIRPIHVTDGDDVGFEGLRPDGEQYNIGKCWCGSRIDVTAGQNCWEACGKTKPNFANADKITPLYRQKDGVKAVKDSIILRLMDEAPDIIGVVNTRRAECCSNCNKTGLSKVNYKYWLAKNCCDPTDTTMVRVFDEPTAGQGFSYVDRNDELISGEYPIYCYEFTHEVLMGCAWDRRMGMTIATSRFIDDVCNNAVDDYDTAISEGRCLGCPQDLPYDCNIPYGDVVQTSTSTVSVFSLDYGGNNPELGLPAQTITIDFAAGKSPNRAQVYRILDNNEAPYTYLAAQTGQFDFDSDSNLIKVADSLWVGDVLNGYVNSNTPQFNTFLSVFNQLTSNGSVYDLEFWRYYGDCENTWSVANNSPTDNILWTNQQTVNIVYPGMTQNNSIPQSHIPVNPGGSPITRAEGFQGQLNIDANYPSQGGLSLASDGQVRFKFTKPSGQRKYLVVVWGYNGEKDGWTLSTQCPEECGVETNLFFSENQDCLPNSLSPNVNATLNFDSYPYDQYGIPELDLEASFSFNIYSDNYFTTSEASVPQYTYDNWFQPQQSGYYDFKLLFDIRTSGAATNWVQILPELYEYVDGTMPHEQYNTGASYDYDNNVWSDGTWKLVAQHDNISTHFCNSGYFFIPPENAAPEVAHTYSSCSPVNVGGHYVGNFSNVYLDSNKKYFFGFTKTWIPGYEVPGTDFGLFDSPDVCDPEQTLYIHDAIMYTTDYTPHYELTTLFVSSDNPNMIDPCDKIFLDPCCSVPANGSVSIPNADGTVNNINVNDGQVTFTDCVEYPITDPCDDWWAPWIDGASGFVPNCDLTSTWSPIVNPGLVDCTNYRLDVFNRWGQLIWAGTTNQPWDGTVGNLSQPIIDYQEWEDNFGGPWDIDCCGTDNGAAELVFAGVYNIKVTVWSTNPPLFGGNTTAITQTLDVYVEPDCIG